MAQVGLGDLTNQMLKGGNRELYTALGVSVCLKFSSCVTTCGRNSWSTSRSTCIHVYGIKPRTHENVNRKPKHVLTVEVTKSVVTILTNYAAQHGLLMPVAPPSSNGVPLFTAIPVGQTEVSVYCLYKTACKKDMDTHVAGLASFLVLVRW